MTTLALLFLILAGGGLLAGAVRLRRMRLEEARRARAAYFQRELDALAAKRRREDADARIIASTKRIAREVYGIHDYEPAPIVGWDD